MQVNVLIISISLTLAVFIFAAPQNSTAFSANQEETAKYYKTCIVNEIAKCDSKLVMLSTSKSKNLQDYAKMEAYKAEFFKAEKERLIREMVEIQLDPKHYKVELYINSRFQERD
jgi:hypothetical protein